MAYWISGQSRELDALFGQLVVFECETTYFGGADWLRTIQVRQAQVRRPRSQTI